jgi:hypothetical protein
VPAVRLAKPSLQIEARVQGTEMVVEVAACRPREGLGLGSTVLTLLDANERQFGR